MMCTSGVNDSSVPSASRVRLSASSRDGVALAALSLCVLAQGACGRLDFQPEDAGSADAATVDGGAVDGGAVDGSAVDAGPPPEIVEYLDVPLCGLGSGAWRLSDVRALTELNSTVDDIEPHFQFDGVHFNFGSPRGGSRVGVYETARATPGGSFAAPAAVAGLSALPYDVWHLALGADGLSGLVSSARFGGRGRADLWLVSRPSRADPFTFGRELSELDTPNDEHDPWLSQDGLRVYFVTIRTGRGQDLYVAERADASAPFDPPTAIAEINSTDGEDNPTLTMDERVILFGSTRPGGAGSSDIWIAFRPDRASPFSTPVPFLPLNTAARENEVAVSVDGCEIVYSSARAGGMGGMDLYRAEVLPL